MGFNHIDIDAAKARGLAVSNTPDVLTDATADIAMTLLLMVARRTGRRGAARAGGPGPAGVPPTCWAPRSAGKTLGLVGMGRIARAVAQRAHHGFGMKVIFHDPYPAAARGGRALGAEPRSSLEQVLEEADFVSLHCPATPETRHLMNRERLARMRPERVSDQHRAGRRGGRGRTGGGARRRARSPAPGSTSTSGSRRSPRRCSRMENVVLLPHLGSATQETRVAMGMRALENLRLFFSGKPLRDRVV